MINHFDSNILEIYFINKLYQINILEEGDTITNATPSSHTLVISSKFYQYLNLLSSFSMRDHRDWKFAHYNSDTFAFIIWERERERERLRLTGACITLGLGLWAHTCKWLTQW